MLSALQRRSEEWTSERLHAVVRGTRTDPRHPLHSTASGCLDLLQEWLYDSGVSHSDMQEAIAEEACIALQEALHTQLQPAALECLPALADTLARASHHSSSERMANAAQDMLSVWATCSPGPRHRHDKSMHTSQPLEVPTNVRADVEALLFASSDLYLEHRVSEAVEIIAGEDVRWNETQEIARLSKVLSPFAQVRCCRGGDLRSPIFRQGERAAIRRSTLGCSHVDRRTCDRCSSSSLQLSPPCPTQIVGFVLSMKGRNASVCTGGCSPSEHTTSGQ